jgi:hypothetical protein
MEKLEASYWTEPPFSSKQAHLNCQVLRIKNMLTHDLHLLFAKKLGLLGQTPFLLYQHCSLY